MPTEIVLNNALYSTLGLFGVIYILLNAHRNLLLIRLQESVAILIKQEEANNDGRKKEGRG